MRHALLATARLTLAAWVGAAGLFVVTGVREVTTDEGYLRDSAVRDALVAARFPAYYAFGFSLVATGTVCVVLLPGDHFGSSRRKAVVLGLLCAVLLLMAVDYVAIYRPLLEMVTPPGQVRPARFVQYHSASKWINAVDIGMCVVAAVLLCWPVRTSSRPSPA